MATERLVIEVSQTGAKRVQSSIKELGTTAESAGRKADQMGLLFSKATRNITEINRGTAQVKRLEDEARRLNAEVERTNFQFTGLKGLLGTIGLGLTIREVVQLSDAYTTLSNRLRVVVDSEEQLTRVRNQLFAVSQRTRSDVEANVDLFSRLSLSAAELGRSEKELLQFTESLNQAIKISGATAQEARAGLIQLSQGIASGALRGDELRSVLEQLPAVADVIAKSLGVTRGRLRELGQQGLITADIILDAFKKSREELADRFGKTLPTIGEGAVQLKNSIIQLTGSLNALTGAAGTAATALQGIANIIDNLDPQNVSRLLAIIVFGRKEFIAREAELLELVEAGERATRLEAKAFEENARKLRDELDTRKDLSRQLKAEALQREKIRELILSTPAAPVGGGGGGGGQTIRGTLGLTPLGILTPEEPIDTSALDLIATDFENTFLDITNTARDNTKALLDGISRDTSKAGESFADLGTGIKKAFEGIDVSIQGLGQTIGESFLRSIDQASVALADFAVSGLRDTDQLKQAFSDLFQQLARDILAATIRLIILRSLFGEGGVGGGGGLLGLLGVNSPSTNQIGGPLSSGETSVVGERGPELFTAPQGGGRVTRSEDIGQLGLRPVVNLRIVNLVGGFDSPELQQNDDQEEFVLNVIQKNSEDVKKMVLS